jgi:hypothetical protein
MAIGSIRPKQGGWELRVPWARIIARASGDGSPLVRGRARTPKKSCSACARNGSTGRPESERATLAELLEAWSPGRRPGSRRRPSVAIAGSSPCTSSRGSARPGVPALGRGDRSVLADLESSGLVLPQCATSTGAAPSAEPRREVGMLTRNPATLASPPPAPPGEAAPRPFDG